MIPYATPTEVGDIIESAADPRFEAPPAGSVLLDRDGVTTTKREGGTLGRIRTHAHPVPRRRARPVDGAQHRTGGRPVTHDPAPAPTTTVTTTTVTTPAAPCDGPNCPPRPSLDY